MNKILKLSGTLRQGIILLPAKRQKAVARRSGRSKLLISAVVAGGLLSSFEALATGNEPGTPVGTGSGWVAIGQESQANAFTDGNGASTAVGYKAFAEGTWSSAIGAMTHAIGPASMAFGVMPSQPVNEVSLWAHRQVQWVNIRWHLGDMRIRVVIIRSRKGINPMLLV